MHWVHLYNMCSSWWLLKSRVQDRFELERDMALALFYEHGPHCEGFQNFSYEMGISNSPCSIVSTFLSHFIVAMWTEAYNLLSI